MMLTAGCCINQTLTVNKLLSYSTQPMMLGQCSSHGGQARKLSDYIQLVMLEIGS